MKIPKAVWVVLIVGLLLNLIAILVAIHNPDGHSYPQAAPVPASQVNYDKISNIIAQQIAQLPKAQNGTNGKDGTNGVGTNGTSGSDGSSPTPDQITSAVNTYLQNNPPAAGPQGNPGTPAAPVELQYNPAKAELEWRYVGDFTWRSLLPLCTLTNTCT